MNLYLLAAGSGRRAGGPKAWRDHGGRSLLARHVDFARRVFPHATLSVSIQADWLGRCEALARDVTWVAVDPSLPPFASLLALIDAQPPDDWAFVYHVDMPLWERGIFDALLERARSLEGEGCPDAVVPTHGGRRGHPALIPPNAAASLRAIDPDEGRLDVWLREHRVVEVELDAPSVVENWNAFGADGRPT